MDYLKYLEESAGKQKSAYDKVFEQYKNRINLQQQELPQQYNQARGQAYSMARISAIGNNESLANVGLAGNLYNSPKSGYSETSRLTQDINLQNTLNGLGTEERAAASSLQQALSAAYAEKASTFAEIDSNLYTQKASAEKELADNSLTMAQQYASQGLMLPDNYKQAYEAQAGENAYGELLKRYSPTGYNYYYNLDDVERQTYDKYFNNEQDINTNITTLVNDYNDGTIDETTISKLLDASREYQQTYTNQQLMELLVGGGYFGEDNKDKYKALKKALNTYETTPTAEEVLAELGDADGKIGGLSLHAGKDPINWQDMREEIKSKKFIHYNGYSFKGGEIPSLDNASNGDIVKWKNGLYNWDDYVYYNGSWFKLE